MRAARFLIIGCVGGIMTSRWRVVEGGGWRGRRRRSVKQNVAPRAMLGALRFSQALPSQMLYKDVSESLRRK